MRKLAKARWGRKASYVAWGALALGLLGFLVWLVIGRLDFDEPWVKLKTPVEVVGVKTTLAIEAGDAGSGLKEVKVTFSQGDRHQVVLDRHFPPGGEPGKAAELPVTLEPKALGFKEGKATLAVLVRDRSWRNWFQGRSQTLTREVVIDLVPLTLGFQSVSHLLHAGGTGLICYRLNKPAKESGILLGGRLYQGFPNPKGKDGEYVVLFPVPREAAGQIQAELEARPSLGTEVKQVVSLKVKPRKWRRDNMNLTDGFLTKVAASFPVAHPQDLLQAYLEVNRDLRRRNHERFIQICSHSQPQPLWSGAFTRFLGKPMARYGDQRTYLYQGKTVDHQVHLGEDLASLINSPVPAANNGVVVLAEPLGIYGQTVILDHGLGVFSSYSHLSQINVKVGDRVEKGTPVGKTGMTGLAGGDHLHFAMIIQGEFVDPLEWWDAHWLRDQVERVWAQAGAPVPQAVAAAAPKKGKGKKAGKARSKAGKKKKKK
jgi:murein DD-endopeptidase MepM/ murein hydrolase activator NlpD